MKTFALTVAAVVMRPKDTILVMGEGVGTQETKEGASFRPTSRILKASSDELVVSSKSEGPYGEHRIRSQRDAGQQQDAYTMTFDLDCISVQVKVNHDTGELGFSSRGRDGCFEQISGDDDHGWLKGSGTKSGEKALFLTDSVRSGFMNLGQALDEHESLDTKAVGTIAFSASRAAWFLSEWPGNKPIKHDNIERVRKRSLKKIGHGRKLVGTSLCDQIGEYVQVMHDDINRRCSWSWSTGHICSRVKGAPETTYMAQISNLPCYDCPDGGETQFHQGDSEPGKESLGWTCFEPDHDPDWNWARGCCFGRCGSNCDALGGKPVYSQACANHDGCLRFGHDQVFAGFQPNCDDEYLLTADDFLLLPECNMGTNP